MNGYYSVFDPDGKKIADCGIERDAVHLMHTRNKYWDGHYFTFMPLPGDLIDVSNNILPPNQKYIGWKNVTEEEFDVEFIKVGGQQIPIQQKQLPQNDSKPFNP